MIPLKVRSMVGLIPLFAVEFLSHFGVHSLSRVHADHPYVFRAGNADHTVAFISGEADSGLFGGNLNWPGPVWFPVNFLLIEALRRHRACYGDEFQWNTHRIGSVEKADRSSGRDFGTAFAVIHRGCVRAAAVPPQGCGRATRQAGLPLGASLIRDRKELR